MEGIAKKPRILNFKKGMAFYLKMGLFLALIFAHHILGYSLPVSIFLLLGGAIALTGDRDEILTLGVCCIPLLTVFQYKYLLLFCIVIYYVKYPEDIKLNRYVLPLLILMIWELMHAMKYNFSLNEFLRNFSELIFCTFLMVNTYKKVNAEKLYRMFAICTIAMAMFVLIKQLEAVNYHFELVFQAGYRLGATEGSGENFGLGFNANALGYISNLSIAGLLQLFTLKKQRTIDYVMIFALLFIGTMTMSRAFLVCLAVLFFMFIWARSKGTIGKIRSLTSVIIILLFAYYVIQFLAPFVIENFMLRFEEKDITNGRSGLFLAYTKHIFSTAENTFFGLGLQHLGAKLRDLYGITKFAGNVLHNGTQEVVVAWGLPGLAMFIYFLGEMVHSAKQHKKMKKHSFQNYIPFLLAILYAQFGQLVTSGIALLSFSFAYMALCTDLGGEENENL